jgi:hypothetical protein
MPNSKETNKWFALTDKANAGGFDSLSKTERTFWLNLRPDIDEEAFAKYKALSGQGALKPGEFAAFMEQFRQSVVNNKADVLSHMEGLEKTRTNKALTQGINTILAGGDLILAQNQINKFKARERGSRRPGAPSVLQPDPYLAAAKADALQGTYAPSVAERAANAGIQEAYQGDLTNAKIASGGQASQYQANAQAAVSRRGRRSVELAPSINDITMQAKARVDRLAGMSSQENQAINQSRAQNYPYDLQQYQFDQYQLANLGRAGFENRRFGQQELAQNIPGLADQFITDRYNRYKTRVGDKFAEILANHDAESLGIHNNSKRNELGVGYNNFGGF